MKQNDIPGNRGMVVPQGYKYIPTSEARDFAVSGAGAGKLTTPDSVPNVVVPHDGAIICAAYSARWKESVSGQSRAGFFLDSQPVEYAASTSVGGLASAGPSTAGAADIWVPLVSGPVGMALTPGSTVGASGDIDPVIGQALGDAVGGTAGVGGPCYIWVKTAGTYEVSVRFNVFSGVVTAKERRLWVWTMEFPVL